LLCHCEQSEICVAISRPSIGIASSRQVGTRKDRRGVIASEAWQSPLALDCFVALAAPITSALALKIHSHGSRCMRLTSQLAVASPGLRTASP
jgi:hypothetical protein